VRDVKGAIAAAAGRPGTAQSKYPARGPAPRDCTCSICTEGSHTCNGPANRSTSPRPVRPPVGLGTAGVQGGEQKKRRLGRLFVSALQAFQRPLGGRYGHHEASAIDHADRRATRQTQCAPCDEPPNVCFLIAVPTVAIQRFRGNAVRGKYAQPTFAGDTAPAISNLDEIVVVRAPHVGADEACCQPWRLRKTLLFIERIRTAF
jgi:hypothetical protein